MKNLGGTIIIKNGKSKTKQKEYVLSTHFVDRLRERVFKAYANEEQIRSFLNKFNKERKEIKDLEKGSLEQRALFQLSKTHPGRNHYLFTYKDKNFILIKQFNRYITILVLENKKDN